ncbi:uncharacterized protein TRIVIDRAFT_160183 [Trichoderma virens Gv29-8]|uniref:Uncharacterized protein n=1 Tax=Hypocrea virens (strain Gv29-8 / FGSC 10586) TaxID=413071 RepID=G9N7C9_HYPVG|nr:uncharacterized protein TRIVIDRAFT_160183 [Trichoderma virens Gv29-8]EHK17626.1 hypothetical protein TRIVIDRAFT_160183 [Trichoderma virens Gv29-8]
MATQTAKEIKTHNEYTVGWVCALPKELTAATAMLDQRHGALPKPANDSNTYTLGSIGKHNVVIACLPKGHIGNNSAATVATQMVSTFPSVRFGLMVGIGGGIPPKVRLGDVVVSTPVGSFPGVVQWDFGKATDGGFERTGSLNNPPSSLLTAITALETEHDLVGSKIPEYLDELKQKWPRLVTRYLKSGSMKDVLFRADYVCESTAEHDIISNSDAEDKEEEEGGGEEEEEEEEEESCRFCDKTKAIQRTPRDMRVHYGLIASGNQVIKSATHRDKLNKDLSGKLLCIEMEAAGLMNNFPCIIIRGICDYADSHKNKDWQEYAAAIAAAFAKELLGYVQPSDVDGERTVKDILGDVHTSVSATRLDVSNIKSNLDNDMNLQILDWITSIDYGPQQSDFFNRRQPETGQWLLDSTEYRAWLGTEKQTLFCPGIPGAGKTILTSIVVDHLENTFKAPKIGIAYIYCNYKRQEEQVIEKLLSNLLKQLSRGQHPLPNCVRDMYSEHNYKRTRPSLSKIQKVLHSVVEMFSRVFIVVDALDECQNSNGCRQNLFTELFNLQEKCEVNLFVTSRFIPDIVDRFTTASISLEIRASTDDIQTYLKNHISQLPILSQQKDELQKEVVTVISEAVDGMFLLAQIYLKSLSDKITTRDIKDALKGFQKSISGPEEKDQAKILADAYNQTMLRINGQQPGFKDLAHKVLSCIICAERQLTITELQHALAVEVNDTELDEDNLPAIQVMVSVCDGLVIVDDDSNIIRLVHYTTQQYFDQTRESWFPNAEIIMTEICITYLLFNAFESGPCHTNEEFLMRMNLNPLYNYAAQNWGHHARKAFRLSNKVKELLECEAKVYASIEALITFGYNDKEYHKMTSLHLSAFFGIKEAAKVLLEKTADVDTNDHTGATPLSWSARNGHEAVTKLLLATSSIKVNSRDRYGRTPLLWAAQNGHKAIVKQLLAMPDVEINSKDWGGDTPLSIAISRGHEAIVKSLLAMPSIKVNTTDITASEGHEAVVKLLLALPSINVNSTDSSGQTPLSAASNGGHEAVVKLLLTVPSIEVNSTDLSGRTPLWLAANGGHEAVVKSLLAIPSIKINSTDSSGQTPLSAASNGGHEASIINLLLTAGADLNIRNVYNQTPLQEAVERGQESVVSLLLEAGADPNLRNKYNGQTPLWAAVRRGKESIINLLLMAGADPNIRDKCNQTPLQEAVERGQESVVSLLLKAGSDLSPEGHHTRILLSTAARCGYTAVIKILLAAGVNPDIEDISCHGQTPLWIAQKLGHTKIVNLLTNKGTNINLVGKDNKAELLTTVGTERKRKYEEIE